MLPKTGVPAAGAETWLFPGRSRLPITSSWLTAVLVATGGSLMVVVSLGAMAAELGNVSVWVWIATAAVGGAQCLLIAELAARFPDRAGGTAQFAYRVRAKGSPSMGALSAWCYWFAWTPGIAVNLILAATFLRNQWLPGVSPVVLALGIAAVLYFVTALGLKLSTVINAVLALVAVAVVLVVVLCPVARPHSSDLSHVFPSTLPADSGGNDGFWAQLALIAKWGFVATWSSYAAEMASTVCAEIRHPERTMKRVMSTSAIICFVAFAAVPIAMFALSGTDGVQKDPFEVFANAGNQLLGPTGEIFVQLGLTAVLILGAETFIIGSSRTIYQMAQDGHLPPAFGKINKRGAPVGSIVFDAVVIGLLLIAFGTNVVDVVAAANFGYMVVFVLLPIAYLVLRKHPAGRPGSFRLGRYARPLAVVLCAINAALLIVGGAQWGGSVMLIGLCVSLVILPISYFTRRRRAKSAPSEAKEPELAS
ncbi:APC family permease [Streptomyces sp. ICN988]|uniref:APC family permease n=1 Tax=Streptomyces sp. ICN988 TaxID=2983765 RepID=UPI0021E3A545|nr:APC family permease [Streptomyces sp. ICN988]MCV2458208.1 APC family permease [Streptomyces sp. ICN988]